MTNLSCSSFKKHTKKGLKGELKSCIDADAMFANPVTMLTPHISQLTLIQNNGDQEYLQYANKNTRYLIFPAHDIVFKIEHSYKTADQWVAELQAEVVNAQTYHHLQTLPERKPLR